ncbi:hypothetical protein J6590_021498 [Homalodisca vitripennis]|nr:hypothetical protein J6590_021498 [Homalodisca vitripennis]
MKSRLERLNPRDVIAQEQRVQIPHTKTKEDEAMTRNSMSAFPYRVSSSEREQEGYRRDGDWCHPEPETGAESPFEGRNTANKSPRRRHFPV